ncbi:uncharacterized protein LOC129599608 [Paramacrobiotus metropolitanus]|uniref:uncharacterized protein LOC129599608 n=1 Tax=Paramacrobiotus metropolitanus TaxID=2943436 RepID=UPI002445F4C2|nr:uncharacterized protein LOC129599608 [Paramacrobiotus metropolitanus]
MLFLSNVPTDSWICIRYIHLLINTVVLLAVLMMSGARLHEASTESVTLWTDLITAHQNFQNKQAIHSVKTADLLLFLQNRNHRHHGLTLAGFATLTRNTAVTLGIAFSGFVGFLMERSEDFREGELVSDMLKNLTESVKQLSHDR